MSVRKSIKEVDNDLGNIAIVSFALVVIFVVSVLIAFINVFRGNVDYLVLSLAFGSAGAILLSNALYDGVLSKFNKNFVKGMATKDPETIEVFKEAIKNNSKAFKEVNVNDTQEDIVLDIVTSAENAICVKAFSKSSPDVKEYYSFNSKGNTFPCKNEVSNAFLFLTKEKELSDDKIFDNLKSEK